MKIAIIGAGNIGSLLGALLADERQDVTLVELRKDIVGAIQAGGVRIDMSDGRTLQAAVKITDDVATVGVADLVVLAVKSNATRGGDRRRQGIIGAHTWVLSVQNGAGNVEDIVDVLGDDSHVIGGVFWCVVTPLELNRLSWVVGTGGLKIGPANGVVSPEVDEIADAFQSSGSGRGRLDECPAAHLGQGAAERPPGAGDRHEAHQRRVRRVSARQRATHQDGRGMSGGHQGGGHRAGRRREIPSRAC